MQNDLFLPRQSNALYVYYNALHGHESDAYKWLGAEKAQAFQNFQLSFSNNTNSRSITEALKLLKIAGEYELKKESAYCNALLQKMKDNGITLPLKTGHEILPNVDNADSVFSLYKTLNDLLKSQQVAEAIIQNELNYQEQIQTQEEAIHKKIKLIKEQKILPTDTDEIKKQKQDTSRQIRYSVYNMLPKRTAREINKEVSDIAGEIANAHDKLKPLIETVIIEFGPVLFQRKNNKLVLNSAQVVLLIREISRLILQRLRTDSSKPKKTKNNIKMIIDNLWHEEAQKQQLINSLKKAELSHYTVFETSNASDISILKNFLTNAEYQQITEQFGPYKPSGNPFSTLINQYTNKKTTVSNVDLLNENNNEYEILMNALNYIDIKIWEEAELESVTELAVNAFSNYSYHHGKSKVLKADSEAGYLHYSCSIDENKIRNDIQRAERRMEALSRELEKKLRVGAATADYESNYQEYQRNRDKQQKVLEKLREKLERQGAELNQILTQFNIHTSNKFQGGILDLYANSELQGTGYFGGAVGEGDRGFSVIDNIQALAAKVKTMSPIDVDSLKLLLINTAPIAVGSKLKEPLEKYFSMFVGYLLFDDAFNIAEDAAKSMEEEAKKFEVSVKDIHLFNFNGLYVPLSYILLQSYAALFEEYSKIQIKIDGSNSIPAKAVILNANHPKEPGVTKSDWDREAKNAEDNTRIKVILMQNFLAFLQKLR